jgi:glycosyltransferase involved in cell wall biosynthesis
MKKISLLVSYSGDGGVEKITNDLLKGLVKQGVAVDLLMIKALPPFVSGIPPEVNQIHFRRSSARLATPELVEYLQRERPPVLMAAKHRGLLLALRARKAAGVDTAIIGQIHSEVTASLVTKPWYNRMARLSEVRKHYPKADAIIGVSQGVVDDLVKITAMPGSKFRCIYYPILDDSIISRAAEKIDHPWMTDDRQIPVFLGVGRFTNQKGFDDLIRAFAEVRKQRPARLIILGRGPLQAEHEALAVELNVAEDIDFAGFLPNPLAYMSKCDVFVLSSRWEGFGIVLAEAMAAGAKVVSTDCPSGPGEILMQGACGPLVAVGDIQAMANAMLKQLDAHHDPAIYEISLKRFRSDFVTSEYMNYLASFI